MGSMLLSIGTITALLLLFGYHGQAVDTAAGECEERLLLLLPCMSFVQGLVPLPADICCDNLVNVYQHHPTCLCLLLDQSITSLPINRSLAMQLPPLCDVSADESRCATAGDGNSTTTSPSQDSPAMNGTNSSNSTSSSVAVASCPMIPSGFLFGLRSQSNKSFGTPQFLLLAAFFVLQVLIASVQDTYYWRM